VGQLKTVTEARTGEAGRMAGPAGRRVVFEQVPAPSVLSRKPRRADRAEHQLAPGHPNAAGLEGVSSAFPAE
jgi:hypothetical protein